MSNFNFNFTILYIIVLLISEALTQIVLNMQRKASEARRLHSQQTIKVARLSHPIKVSVTQRGGGKRKGGIWCSSAPPLSRRPGQNYTWFSRPVLK